MIEGPTLAEPLEVYDIIVWLMEWAGMAMRVLESGIDYLDVLLRILGKGRDAMQNWLSEGRVVKYFVVHGEVEVSSKMRAFVEVDK